MLPTSALWDGSPRILSEDLQAPVEPLALLLRPGAVADAGAVVRRAARALLDLPEGPCASWPSWLAAHQRPAAERLAAILDRYGGALLADAVGLGKSYVALAVALACGAPRREKSTLRRWPQWRRGSPWRAPATACRPATAAGPWPCRSPTACRASACAPAWHRSQCCSRASPGPSALARVGPRRRCSESRCCDGSPPAWSLFAPASRGTRPFSIWRSRPRGRVGLSIPGISPASAPAATLGTRSSPSLPSSWRRVQGPRGRTTSR